MGLLSCQKLRRRSADYNALGLCRTHETAKWFLLVCVCVCVVSIYICAWFCARSKPLVFLQASACWLLVLAGRRSWLRV